MDFESIAICQLRHSSKAPDRNRTDDGWICNPTPYHLATGANDLDGIRTHVARSKILCPNLAGRRGPTELSGLTRSEVAIPAEPCAPGHPIRPLPNGSGFVAMLLSRLYKPRFLMRETGVEPACLSARDPKSRASASSATRASFSVIQPVFRSLCELW